LAYKSLVGCSHNYSNPIKSCTMAYIVKLFVVVVCNYSPYLLAWSTKGSSFPINSWSQCVSWLHLTSNSKCRSKLF
jgi:hypothetical protein